jgi:hypothetical protein
MHKGRISLLLASLFFALTGCGGSNGVGSTADPAGGVSLSQYQATLPDGSPMEMEIFADDSNGWSGNFAVASVTGPYAEQTGSFQGTVTNGAVNATGDIDSGGTFQLTGTDDGDAGFHLTRSDLPGVVLNFTKVAAPTKGSRATVTFKLDGNGTSGQCALSDQPFSSTNGITEYRGTWQSCKVTFWSYSTGYANIVIYVNDFAIYNITLASYRLSDFASVTKAASSASLSIYNPISKVVMRYNAAASTVSPG